MARKIGGKKLSGLNPLAYTGVNPSHPSNTYVVNRPPTINDYNGYALGDIWVDRRVNGIDNVYILTSKDKSITAPTGPAIWTLSSASSGTLETLTGNSGGAISPAGGTITFDGTDPVDVVGDNSMATLTFSVDETIPTTFVGNTGTTMAVNGVITIAGGNEVTTSGSGSTVTINAASSLALSFKGDSGTATPSSGVITLAGGNGITTSGSGSTVTYDLDTPVIVADGGTGAISFTDHGVLVGSGTDPITALAVGLDGQVLIGATGADPVFAFLTSSDGSIEFTFGANSLNIEAPDSATLVVSGDSGTATPAASTLVIAGGTNVDTAGASNTVTINAEADVTSSFVADSGTATPSGGTLVMGGGSAITTTGSGSTISFDLEIPVPVDEGGTSSLTLTDHAVLLGNSTAALATTNVGDNGDVLIGATGGNPVFSVLTSDGGSLTFSTGANSLDIQAADPSLNAQGEIITDDSTATAVAGEFNIVGVNPNMGAADSGITTSAAVSTVTINLDVPIDVPLGGTDNTSFTAYSVITGGTTDTGALQNVSGLGTSGQVLTSNGSSALPTWQDASWMPPTCVTIDSTTTLAVNTCYFLILDSSPTDSVVLTLPDTCAFGDTIEIWDATDPSLSSATIRFQLVGGSGQTIIMGVTTNPCPDPYPGNREFTTLKSTAKLAYARVVCVEANTKWHLIWWTKMFPVWC